MQETHPQPTPEPQQGIGNGLDRPIFFGSVIIILSLCLPLALYPEDGQQMLGRAFDYLTHNFGIVYLIGSVATLLFLLYLALSRYGDIELGDTRPDFSTFSWSAMLFCGGIGTSILYWGTVEWAHYYESPPFSVAAGTPEALNWAVSYPIFHWGLIGWALCCLRCGCELQLLRAGR